ncbi:hypothetical protein IQ230_24650 [Gloeocapsopsis crepidinum LEGE 06123]|uniref:Uncharacterized protein n=1 Tax=Gloeocapsopsis crepidinum LEGE 06123 TaxID=588587 RepID=A0ABR9UYT1_9CHRO|nr:hypothetical protein [Gloeocapsopsis crepidinum]MBE9193469.1 hypothetical protein [Gloeocapsopsis crepidinum LEGE 06123]
MIVKFLLSNIRLWERAQILTFYYEMNVFNEPNFGTEERGRGVLWNSVAR